MYPRWWTISSRITLFHLYFSTGGKLDVSVAFPLCHSWVVEYRRNFFNSFGWHIKWQTSTLECSMHRLTLNFKRCQFENWRNGFCVVYENYATSWRYRSMLGMCGSLLGQKRWILILCTAEGQFNNGKVITVPRRMVRIRIVLVYCLGGACFAEQNLLYSVF